MVNNQTEIVRSIISYIYGRFRIHRAGCILPLLIDHCLYSTPTIKSLRNKAVSDCKYLITHYGSLQTASQQIAPEETFLSPTEIPFHNFVHRSVAPSIPIVRE